MKGLFVTGTDTNVGKTWVGSSLLSELTKLNIPVKARKPVESGWPTGEDITSTDAWKLAQATNNTNALDEICPNQFSAALSPDRAAMLENKTLNLDDLYKDCLRGVTETDFLYVEGAGGFYSPISDDGLNADLANLLNESAILATRYKKKTITKNEVNEAADRIIGGIAGATMEDTKNKKLIAYHEVGHALAGTLLKNHDDVQKVTLIPRGRVQGFTLFTPDEQPLMTRGQLSSRLIGTLGGRAAEEIVFGKM